VLLKFAPCCIPRLLATRSQPQSALAPPLRANRVMILRLVHDLAQARRVRRVRRDPTACHRRAYDVTLTSAGRAVLAHTAVSVDVVEAATLASLSANEQAQFRALLRRLMHAPEQGAADACAEDA
jgi:DNA-binding MarR family transcriptional regulator